jgi:hypothetical protein
VPSYDLRTAPLDAYKVVAMGTVHGALPRNPQGRASDHCDATPSRRDAAVTQVVPAKGPVKLATRAVQNWHDAWLDLDSNPFHGQNSRGKRRG